MLEAVWHGASCCTNNLQVERERRKRREEERKERREEKEKREEEKEKRDEEKERKGEVSKRERCIMSLKHTLGPHVKIFRKYMEE